MTQHQQVHVNSIVPIYCLTLDETNHIILMMFQLLLIQNALDQRQVSLSPTQRLLTRHQADSKAPDIFRFFPDNAAICKKMLFN